MKVSFGEVLLLVLYMCEDAFCFRLDWSRRMLIETKNNKIKEKFVAPYYALLYMDYIYIDLDDPTRFGGPTVDSVSGTCGAAIIDNSLILTAAHCVYQYQYYKEKNDYYGLVKNLSFLTFKGEARVYFGNFSKVSGVFDKIKFAQKLQTLEVEAVHLHPTKEYVNNASHSLNDIAVVKVKGLFPVENILRPCGPADKFGSKKLVETGAGINENPAISGWHLNSVKVVESNKSFCHSPDYVIGDPGSSICTEGLSSCKGDSGGPLAFVDDETMEPVCLYGIHTHSIIRDLKSPRKNFTTKELYNFWRMECMRQEGSLFASVVYYYEDWIKVLQTYYYFIEILNALVEPWDYPTIYMNLPTFDWYEWTEESNKMNITSSN